MSVGTCEPDDPAYWSGSFGLRRTGGCGVATSAGDVLRPSASARPGWAESAHPPTALGLCWKVQREGGVRRSSSPDRFGRRVECRPGRSRRPDAHQHSQWPRTVAAAGPGPRRGRLHGHHPASHPVPGLRRVGLDPGPTFALHLDCGSWRASCTGCGLELAKGRHQDRVEHKAAHRSCPVCVEVA